MPLYDDIYIRDALGEDGYYPSTAATLCFSPDIIAWGTEPLPDANAFLAKNYGSTWYRNPVRGQQNYIYVRVKNLFPGRQSGKVFLYCAVGGAVQDISIWRKNWIGTAIPGQNYVNLNVGRGEVACGDTAFVWTPPATQAQGHYCFIAQIVTEAHLNPLPDKFTTVEPYVKWVADHPDVAWRNIDVIPSTAPPDYQGNFEINNQFSVTQEYLFKLEGFNLPAGTLMQMVCAAAGPNPPVNVSGFATGMTESQIAATSFLPAAFKANFAVTVKLPVGFHWTNNMRINLEQFAITTSTDSPYLKSMSRPTREILHSLVCNAPITYGMAVRLGTFNILVDQQNSS